MKKDTLVMIGNIVLFVLLAGLMVVEVMNPEGGAALLEGLFGAM